MPSQTKLGNLLEAVPDALVGVDRGGVIRFVNRQTESLFGYEREDLIGARLETLLPESLRQIHVALREGYNAAPRTRPMGTDLRLRGRRADGTEFPVDIALSAMNPGDRMLVIAAVRDMTIHRRQEGDRHRLDLLATIVEHCDDAIISSTLDGVITSWNPAAERLYGYSSEEIIGKSIQPVTPQDRTDEINTILAKVRAGRSVEHFETLGVRKDATVFPASLTVSPIHDVDGTITGASVISSDVSERKKHLETIQRLAAIVEYSDDAIHSSTLEGIITSWNPAAQRLYGYSSQEIIGKSGSLLTPDDHAGETRAFLKKIQAGEPVEHYQTIRVRKDGTVFPVSLTASPIRDADGAIIGTCTIARDMTRQEEASDLASALIETSLDPLVTISAQGKITDVNEATIKATGIPRQQLMGTDFCDYFTDPDRANDGYQLVLAQGSVIDYPLTLRHWNGTLTEVLYHASLYHDISGKVLGVFAAARDVTKQVQAEMEIAEQQARELQRLTELEQFQRLTVKRELKMIELKKEIEYLRMSRPTEGDEPGDPR